MKSDNPYVAYFVNQAKGKGHIQLGGSLPGLRGARMQKGLVSCLEDFTVLPYLLQRLAKSLETTLIMKYVAKGRNFRKSLERWGKQEGVEFFSKVKTQMGGGQNGKRKSIFKDFETQDQKRGGSVRRQRGMCIPCKTTTAYSATLDKLKYLSEWHTSCMQVQRNVLFLLWISSTYHLYKRA